MKLILFIFGFYLIALPCVPCTDANECIDADNVIAHHSILNEEDHQHENENCNPFCSCECCGQILTQNPTVTKVSFQKETIDFELKFFYKTFDFSTNYFVNIWQPPKLS